MKFKHLAPAGEKNISSSTGLQACPASISIDKNNSIILQQVPNFSIDFMQEVWVETSAA